MDSFSLQIMDALGLMNATNLNAGGKLNAVKFHKFTANNQIWTDIPSFDYIIAYPIIMIGDNYNISAYNVFILPRNTTIELSLRATATTMLNVNGITLKMTASTITISSSFEMTWISMTYLFYEL